MGNLLNIVSVIKSIYNLIKMFMDMMAKQRLADAERRRQELDKAISDLQKAKTDQEIFDAQKRIVDNSPH